MDLDRRRELALRTLATVAALTVTTTGATGTEYGEWGHYGLTDPLWVGVVSETLFSISWFFQVMAVFDALQIIVLSSYHGVLVGKRVFPYVIFGCGVVVYHVNLFFVDISYWFNLFVHVEMYNLEEGNMPMYLADDVPTGMFILSSIGLFWHRYRTIGTLPLVGSEESRFQGVKGSTRRRVGFARDV